MQFEVLLLAAVGLLLERVHADRDVGGHILGRQVQWVRHGLDDLARFVEQLGAQHGQAEVRVPGVANRGPQAVRAAAGEGHACRLADVQVPPAVAVHRDLQPAGAVVVEVQHGPVDAVGPQRVAPQAEPEPPRVLGHERGLDGHVAEAGLGPAGLVRQPALGRRTLQCKPVRAAGCRPFGRSLHTGPATDMVDAPTRQRAKGQSVSHSLKIIWTRVSRGDVELERWQCESEGRDVTPLAGEFDRVAALDLDDPAHQPAAEALLDAAAELPTRSDFPYDEPDDLAAIRAARPPAVELPTLDDARLADRVHGAWLGRVCGCLLGKPVEGWRRDRMWTYLKDAGRWPLTGYFTRDVPPAVRDAAEMNPDAPWIENVSAMPVDDDTNYTVLALNMLAEKGAAFAPADVARCWLANLPLLATCTAERAAYRNFATNVAPPASARARNPYREWIGAQIRADAYGYVAAGEPDTAAEWAWRDACISHVKNGIYGEMWAAAMIAAAFCTDDVRRAVEAGLAEVPARCRLAEHLRDVLAWHDGGVSYDDAVERIHARWDEHSHTWCHTIPNAMIVAAGLLYGGGEFGPTICRAVQPCFDTDCNGATTGSVIGAMRGAAGIQAGWTDPLHDTLRTRIAGHHRVSIRNCAARTTELIEARRPGDA